MVDKTSLGDRMKAYERVTQSELMPKSPVILRLDGRAFHTFTKRLKHIDPILEVQPYSEVMRDCMTTAACHLVHYIQGAKIAYVQSDEISVLLTDWANFDTQQWFGGKLQKVVSLSAAMASMAFYAKYEEIEPIEYMPHRPIFDSRAFNIPRHDVVNYFIWRQKDAMRNSVNMLGQFHFSHKELQGKKLQDVKDMLWTERKVLWDDLPGWCKRGWTAPARSPVSSRCVEPDTNIPVFTNNREYINKWLDEDHCGDP